MNKKMAKRLEVIIECTGDRHDPTEMQPTVWYDMATEYECPSCRRSILLRNVWIDTDKEFTV